MYRILVVEDDEDIRQILNNYLCEEYDVTLASDGVEAIARFHSAAFDLILLDVMLPKIDGFGVCELIRRESSVPIIMLTALEEEAYQIRGLDLRADDYITKPFSAPVLMRKIAAVLRRTYKESGKERLCYQNLCLDPAGHHVYVQRDNGREEIELTQKEFELLHVLLLNKGLVLTRQKLLDRVWGDDYFGDERIVDTHIKNIRKKLGGSYISTLRGVGYRIDKETEKQFND